MALEEYSKVRHGRSSKPQTVLDEETYTETLEKIITRDFFPDHNKLRRHKEYLEAEERKDFEKMRQIALEDARAETPSSKSNLENPSHHPLPSPACFETPLSDGKGSVAGENFKSFFVGESRTSRENSEREVAINLEELKKKAAENSLNNFLGNYTSEDNDSFESIVESAAKQRREKYAWMYEAEVRHAENVKQMLMLENEAENKKEELLAIACSERNKNLQNPQEHNEEGLGEDSTKQSRTQTTDNDSDKKYHGNPNLYEVRESKSVDGWTYKAKNHLMYYPEGVEDDDKLFKKPLEIVHTNTRFQRDPFKDALDRSKLVEAAAENAKFIVGEKVGHDGKAILPQASPSVNGYGFLATPSPAPGVNMSPIMTWGVIEGTPARLDGSGTPTPGPSFKFPKESHRDILAHKMTDESTKKKRDKKQAALKQVKESMLAGTPKRAGSIMMSERINTLSPAARKLVNKKLGNSSDKRLKQSYTPTPSNRNKYLNLTPISKTPTPGSREPTPQSKSQAYRSPSITDNLLNIKKKKLS